MSRAPRAPLPKAPCIACGRVVAAKDAPGLRTRAWGVGKARVRHKCPHGTWCIAGRITHGFNGPTCRECARDQRAAREAAAHA